MSASRSEMPTSPASTALDADVIIVGYGPVGQCLAAMLGQAGHRVVVCERRQGRYETPRAGHFDHEIMRIFQSLRIADDVRRVADPARAYEFLDSDGVVISRLPRVWDAPSGWDASYHFYQPELEDVLDAAVDACALVDVRYGTGVSGMRHEADHVVVHLENGATVTGRFVVGADGANSIVRGLCDIATEDLGFRGEWLVVDVRRRPGAPEIDIPDTGQVLNPARPNHMGRVSHRYYRWEFMLVDGDDPQGMVEPQRVWSLLEPWVRPGQAELIRQTVYSFRSLVAETFQAGNVFLAGDAAHVMPPFLGQGMSSGVRDAATLSWLLDLVLRGSVRPDLLQLYSDSRRPQVIAYIEESMRVGTVVCETDPVRAAERREALQSATQIPPPFQPAAGAGFIQGQPLAGDLAVQPMVRTHEGKVERADDVLGTGFTLLSLVPLDSASQKDIAELKHRIGLRTLVLGADGLPEEGESAQRWLTAAGVVAVVVRPDFYVFGSAACLADIPPLLSALRTALCLA